MLDNKNEIIRTNGEQGVILGPLCDLGLDLVLAFEHFIDLYEIIGPLDNCLRVAFGRVALLEMSLFPKYAHLH